MDDTELTALALRQLKGHFISYVSELHEGGIDDRLEAALWAAGVIGELSPGSRPVMEHWAYTLYGDQEFEIDVY